MDLTRFAAVAAAVAALPGIHAHRGGSVIGGVPTYPENTMPAFRHAAREGYELEMDAKLTKDGVPVVIHDATLERTTPCSGEVRDFTFSALRSCPSDVLGNPASALPSRPARESVPLPTLAEALAFARREGAVVNLEIKNVPTDPDFDAGSSFANRVMDVVLASGIPRSRLIVQSFWPANLDIARSRLPDVQTSYLTSLRSLNSSGPGLAAANGYEWVSPEWPVDAAYVAEARARGRRVVPYTLDRASDVRAAAGLRVDALITDDPLMAQRTLGLRRSQLVPDRIRPRVRLAAPRFASDVSRSRRFRVRWRGSDRGSGIARYRLEVRRNTNVSTRWVPVRRRTRRCSATFRGRAGVSYLFRLRARDRYGNLSRYAYGTTVVPRDDRSRRLRLTAGWRRLRARGAYGRTLTRAGGTGPSARFAFRGTRAAVIAHRSRRGGRLLVTLAGRSQVVSLRGRRRHRRAVFRSRRLLSGRHVLRLRALGGGRIDLDAIGVDTGPGPPRR